MKSSDQAALPPRGAVKLVWSGAASVSIALAGGEVVASVGAPQPRMGDPLAGLTAGELARFEAGKLQYNRNFLAEEGLGPIFNKESCGNCHSNPLGGPGSQTVTRAGMSDKKGGFDALEHLGGSLFQQQAISVDCAEAPPPEADVIRLRVTPGMMGYGLVEAILDTVIEANEDPLDTNGDSISGRVHWVPAVEDPPMSPLRAGRFGWKAQDPTMMTFSAGASLNEIGLTNPFHQTENDPNGIDPPELGDCDMVDDPEVDQAFLDALVDFQRFLAAPPQTPRSGMTGETIFVDTGCALCHTPSFMTPDDAGLEDAIRNKEVKPYSDFLLHDMGLGADDIPQGAATERELKTAPLMGLRTRDPLWHDGRFGGGTFAERVTLAIEEHGLFGSEARNANVVRSDGSGEWNLLAEGDKNLLIEFLGSLGRVEFDADGDGDVELDDFIAFADCFTGPGSFYTADDACAISDADGDRDVDLGDYKVFLLAYEGPQEDCNNNGVLDLTDIIDGTSSDDDGNGIPDECILCQNADFDGANGVDFADLLSMLAAWGPCASCPQDIDGDGVVGFQDLLILLAFWGPCA